MPRVQVQVGAMLVMRRVYEGSDGSEIFALDESRSAATTLFGLAFIQEWTTSPWSLLVLNGESLMHTCSRLPVGTGMHIDPSSSETANLVSPVERCHHLEALAGGLKSIYMLHAGEDLVVKFASWLPGAFEGMEAELLEYAEEHLLRSSNSVSAKHMAHQASVDISRELIRLRQFPTTTQSPYDIHAMGDMGPSDSISADSIRTDSSTATLSSGVISLAASMVEAKTMSRLSSGVISLAASMVEAKTMSLSVQQSRDAAIAVVSAVPVDQLSQIIPAMLLALPEETLPELTPAILLAVPSQRIPAVLSGIIKLLPPDVVQDVMSTVVAALPADVLPELAPAILLAVPRNQITKVTVLQGTLNLLPPDVEPDIVRTVVAVLPADELPELAPAILLAVPRNQIAKVLPRAITSREVAP
jgi:hypothetical protein